MPGQVRREFSLPHCGSSGSTASAPRESVNSTNVEAWTGVSPSRVVNVAARQGSCGSRAPASFPPGHPPPKHAPLGSGFGSRVGVRLGGQRKARFARRRDFSDFASAYRRRSCIFWAGTVLAWSEINPGNVISRYNVSANATPPAASAAYLLILRISLLSCLNERPFPAARFAAGGARAQPASAGRVLSTRPLRQPGRKRHDFLGLMPTLVAG